MSILSFILFPGMDNTPAWYNLNGGIFGSLSILLYLPSPGPGVSFPILPPALLPTP